ncbi:BZ3500_MvSof-1268-A1-R1_Chr8-1g09790 [Microbotryum saponariae]|uniref:BZ3500_MvSof-1268-A1-R1_Chr8-1g09790 protein n=1 Tax=Microbotryum saponariae TaxID=289078 RepID=A0A2X0NPC6_9BASI|nr:BZ3500_MvSof-1268-A1-R1_Chr8-1g09790 [Microbotryum saponariae]SDA08076.1 BZ3501_MvSof-1269-A2-R1_Chr8-1g09513 [Microbotryum saponariae]
MSTKSSWWSSWRSSIQPTRETRRHRSTTTAAASPESRGAIISRPFRVGTRPSRQQRPSLDCVFTLEPTRATITRAEPAAPPVTLSVSVSHSHGEDKPQLAAAATRAATHTLAEAEHEIPLETVRTSKAGGHDQPESTSKSRRIMRKPSDLSSFTSKLVRQLLPPHTSPKASTTTLSTFSRFKDRELPLIPTRPASRSSTWAGKSFEAGGGSHSSLALDSYASSLAHHSSEYTQRTSRRANDVGYKWCGMIRRVARRKSTPAAAIKTIASLGQNWSHKDATLDTCCSRPSISISSPMTRVVFLAHDDIEDGWVVLGETIVSAKLNAAELERAPRANLGTDQ